MTIYVSHYSGRSYTLLLERKDGRDQQIGCVSFERDKQCCWKGVVWQDDRNKVTELFGNAWSAVKWVIETAGHQVTDTEMLVLLSDIIGIEDGESIEIKTEYVPVPVFPIDICEVAGEEDLWQVRLRRTEFDHHGEPHLQTSVLGIFGGDDDGWFTVGAEHNKVHGDAVKVLYELLNGHHALALALAYELWEMFCRLDKEGYVYLSRRGHALPEPEEVEQSDD